LRFVSLCAGIGGIDIGLERAGHQCVGQVEIDPFCQKVLAKHWPDVPRLEDVRLFWGDEFGDFDLLVAGYPCQPFSHASAGRRKGEHDERHLWPEISRLVFMVQPKFVLLENVPAHLELGFGTVLGDLAESGYDAEWQCLPASSFGAPQPRDRLWLVAYPHGYGESISAFDDEARFLPPVEGTSWAGWPSYSSSWGMDDGLSPGLDRSGIRALGNSVAPVVAEWIGRRLPFRPTEVDFPRPRKERT
jgi:DNA (cytosine-5)-methyltransferase 1